MINSNEIIKVNNITKIFKVRTNFLDYLMKRSKTIRAVDDLTFNVFRSEILGLVGESGSGKTTTGRILAGLLKPTGGNVFFKNKDIFNIKDNIEKEVIRTKIQYIYQNPYSCLSPWITVGQALMEPLIINKYGNNKDEMIENVKIVMESVGLTPVNLFLNKYPHELSGGQKQRVVIMRALMLRPEFIIADEPVSMLDVSTRLGILNIILSLKKEQNISSLYITHDIASARYICDRIAVMYLGKIVELGLTDDIIYNPFHPYTKALMKAIPTADPTLEIIEIPIKGGIESFKGVYEGCRFSSRCLYAKGICKKQEPDLIEEEKNHLVSCHFANKLK